MDPILQRNDAITLLSDEDAEVMAANIYFSCQLSGGDPDAAFESVSDYEFDESIFDAFVEADYLPIATESISTNWGDLINQKKEIKMVGNAISKSAGDEINLLPGTDGYSTSAPRKKDGQYYTRATFAFSDGQAVRILFYNPEKPEEKHKYPSNVVSFQLFLNKKDITAQLIKGGGEDYGPRKFGKIIGKLLERNSEKFQRKSAEIQAQKEEMESIDKEIAELDKQISTRSNEATQAKERNAFLKRNHEVWKEKSEKAVADRAEEEKRQKERKALDESVVETEAGKEWVESGLKKFRGKKYDPDMTTKDVAKSVRDDIKAAQKAGQIIDAGGRTYSVTMEKFSMGSSITVTLKKLPEGVELFSDTWKDFVKSGSQDFPEARLRYSDAVSDTLKKVKNIVDQYQRSEASTEPDDYSSTSFYSHVDVDSGLEKTEREKIESEGPTVIAGGKPIDESLIHFELSESLEGKSHQELKSLNAEDALDSIISSYITDFRNALFERGFEKGDDPWPITKVGGELNAKFEYSGRSGGNVMDATFITDINGQKTEFPIDLSAPAEVLAEKVNLLFGGELSVGATAISGMLSKAKPLHVMREVRDFDSNVLDLVQLPYDGTIENAVEVAKAVSKLMWDKYQNASNMESGMIIATDENAKPKWRISPNYKEVTEFGMGEPIEPEGAQQEQVADTAIKQAQIPAEEQPPSGREIGQEYKDRDGVTKPVTHEIDGKEVSAIQEAGYIRSAYIRGNKWINLPLEEKTTINEDDLSAAIGRSETAYQTADDILSGIYDGQGPDKVDQLLDEIAGVIEDDAKLNQVADHYTALLSKKFAPQPETATA